ncbi:hypothetical protein Y032_0601g509 [Ancylostoma ceylanicum]|uniref:Uncharacterized protein n=1 Tax=Ancylostoma ceylanicum TaxID=53326 RepID=A0A016WLK1_9BILA|nr:hypothetical protein Y032_0601g509 [Ancylostoma ceylanicum]
MFMAKFVYECTDTTNSSTIAGSKEQFFSCIEGGIQRPVPPRLGQPDDVVPDLPGLHHQILDGGLRCKRPCVEGTDRHHSTSRFRQPR